jgi:SAM-dependent methyltransferase
MTGDHGGPQEELAHRLPRAQTVDRIEWLEARAKGRRVIHIGFVDVGYEELQASLDSWLHARLHAVADELVGIDIDERGVTEASAAGFESYLADCTDIDALRGLDLDPADVVIAGEVIEHVDNPGLFLDGLAQLCRPGGVLVVTTPNAYGWLNPMAALSGHEVNHPDHVMMFTWRTLTTLLGRHGWEPDEVATYVPKVKTGGGAGMRLAMMAVAARFAVFIQRLASRWAPFVADGLIVTARRR